MNLKQFLISAVQSILFWTIAFILFTVFRYYGFNEEEYQVIIANNEIPIFQWFDVPIYIGVFVGFSYALIELLFNRFITNKVSIGVTLILKNTLYLLILIVLSPNIFFYVEELMDINLVDDWRLSKVFRITVLYFFICSLIFSFIKIANEKFGRGVFLKMLIGKYRNPQEEKRIFMFLDLKNSTSIAEQLGHFKYSQFIQDCFLDLNKIINKFNAEVYQYVGDEAVLSWKYKVGVDKNKCIEVFFSFKEQLQKRNHYYQKKYNTIPKFKAGLHGGKLMVAEVGTIKKELAFHGDVINTTARIQAECNRYSEELLISDKLLKNIQLKEKYILKLLGETQLKGKQNTVVIHSINNKRT
ncbi:adenylate/guanylate cyclase domain-containing protein [Flavobacteriaceae bacterium AU392]|nr:adenylate/guanylate cyclase domain-containing protein [Flavobacteriaceae bacterium]RKM86843.1 adenylate/guanylate cyclase domain-containing protein [Flavobacteriaceae bacterium AU392]